MRHLPLLLAGTLLAAPASAQTSAQTGAADPGARPVAQLYEQAGYWRARGEPERALAAIERILGVRQDDPEALFLAVESAAQLNRMALAGEYLNRLRRALPPGDPRAGRAEASLTVASEGAQALAEARRLAGANRPAEAVARYRQLFRDGQPPAFLQREYLETLAATSDAGHAEAVRELRRLGGAAPGDPQLALSLGTLLTHREETRDDGVSMLRRLVSVQSTAPAARLALRQALLWDPPSTNLVPLLEELLRQLPEDAELLAKLEESRLARRTQRRLEGWNLVDGRQFPEAERRFREVLAAAPEDTEALMGLATLAGIAGRFGEMREFRARAVAIQPDREAEFMAYTESLDREAGRARAAARPVAAAARPPGPARASVVAGRQADGGLPASTLARRALERGRPDEADRLARRAALARGGDERAQGETVLGQLALRREEPAEAERRFRNALALRPADRESTQGLVFALLNQDRIAEAETLGRAAGMGELPGAASRQAFALRETAARHGSDAPAIELLREALRLDPRNAFVRLDLARRLRRLGDTGNARLLEDQLGASGQAEAMAMAALLAAEEERFGDAGAHLARIPDRLRTGEQNRLFHRLRFEAQLRELEARARLDRDPAPLLAVAARPDPSGAAAAAAVRAFARLNDPDGMREAARAGLAANPGLGPEARLDLAAALAEGRAAPEAEALLDAAASAPSLAPEARRQVAFLREFFAVGRADAHLAARRFDAAHAELAPHLAASPPPPQVSTALMRAFARARRYEEAREVAAQLLAHDPLDAAIRASAVDLAVEMEEFGVAEALLAEGQRFDVAGPALLLAEARLARARRHPVRELRALEAATRLRMEELRIAGAEGRAALAAEHLSPARSGARPLPDNADPFTAEMLREMSRARDEAATWVQAGIGVNGRTGTAGLSRSTTVTAPVEITAPLPGLGGRLVVATGATFMSAGRLGGDAASLRQFGSNAIMPGAPAARPDRAQAGAPFSVGYVGEYLRADLGATPLGFRRTSVVGGIEVAIPLGERARLRVAGERRAVTETLLSYAGLRDAASGQVWGGVVRTGGRAQVEGSLPSGIGAYAAVAAARIAGRGVRDNAVWEAGGGVFAALRDVPGERLALGLDARHAAFDRNLSFATLGHGGYFSPQRGNAVTLSADWRRQEGDWFLRANAALGWQWYRTAGAPLFPDDAARQSLAEGIAAADPSRPAAFAGQRVSGLTGQVFLNAEYALSPEWRVGAAGRFTRVGDYQDAAGLLYLRWRLDPAARDIQPLLRAAPAAAPVGSFPFPGRNGEGRPEPVELPFGAPRPTW